MTANGTDYPALVSIDKLDNWSNRNKRVDFRKVPDGLPTEAWPTATGRSPAGTTGPSEIMASG